ncbi:16S rRNA (cytidine(1402)-2'-O)-methyltransferase [Lactococcus piscium]|uniref:Ribosomal RNA small subunit methyltransferase I n=2 Tax=Pseudolactococcus paracarnosus TaxID=2749962 RepID=A0A7L4WBF9_9LACT|nr:16S rRNA (cytidine(1402)-2'-O)-methyltransferase [Lactococcus paracarnosus]SPC36518.1 ribosomal RNA small subunit methyltransferase I [Lactococcus piscium]MCJ1984037.1 16S rRNA (cytidine(1402)-2'-O)-methyltransferase [Lactococcus paracarnosus]MCJ1994146.1 16S rRNA (cytidine(1402)-2'-O)-methyltransferase [Lactococcus paracarnosus]MCJ1999063.1 16S rRNA (cytidine(1402)-2'-O)-methyltransferase [Lactococcus paracarnosus]
MMNFQQSFKGVKTAGQLFLVPTPIGNLDDMTFRAVTILKTVDLIASEDTRNTKKLLNHFEITTSQESFHDHNSGLKLGKMIDLLKSGKSIAQVSDAGLPSISDPGHDLVLACITQGIDVIALPGASAGITALIASGIAPQPHIFYGFLPRKKNEQLAFLTEKVAYPESQIFYESPHRVSATLTNMLAVYGDREVAFVRELTKIYEEYRRGPISEVLASIIEQPIKGECLIIVSGSVEQLSQADSDLTDLEAVQALITAGEKPNAAIKKVAKTRGLVRQELYQAFHQL